MINNDTHRLCISQPSSEKLSLADDDKHRESQFANVKRIGDSQPSVEGESIFSKRLAMIS